ncbi:MAG TPA: L-threonylcarbamoyladenylate synthase, partial [Anaerolineales bacterium]|nr:L-threonylcarbamoyladenylate synthase [Anaerolineales bacterium]
DTVYGLGADAFNQAAVLRIYAAKGRPSNKAIAVLLPSAADLDQVAGLISPEALRLAEKFWPGPLTLVVPKNPRVPDVVAGATVGVRVPDHAVALALLNLSGPLAVTSANLSGDVSPVTAGEVLQQLDGRLELILDGGSSPGGLASTVVDCTQSELVVLRPGPLSREDLLDALR